MQLPEILPLTKEAIDFTIGQLARLAGISGENGADCGFEALGVDFFYKEPSNVKPDKPTIIVRPCGGNSWNTILERGNKRISFVQPQSTIPPGMDVPFSGEIPIIFWGAGVDEECAPFAEQRSDGAIVINADLVAASFFMLSRWEETVIENRDHYDRFPASASLAFKQGFLDRPLVDEYGIILSKWIQLLLPGWSPLDLHPTIFLSHDIDSIRRFRSIRSTARYILEELFVRHNWRNLTGTLRGFVDVDFDPDVKSIKLLAEISDHHHLSSAFYFKTNDPSLFEIGYWKDNSLALHIIRDLLNSGFEVGIHPSHYTYQNMDMLSEEVERLKRVVGLSKIGGRQHNLRFKAPNTWRDWENAGLSYDATVGYADHCGFRCGTCKPFKPFDIGLNRELNIFELPLIVMDVTVMREFADTNQGKNYIMSYAKRCKDVGGVFSLLWHNTSLMGKWQHWAECYQTLIEELVTCQFSSFQGFPN